MNEKTHWLQSPNKNYLGHWDLPESNEAVVQAQDKAKENVDCIRIKKEASITAEILETLYQLKKDKVNESQKVSIERIIIESEKPSYQKVYTYLNKL